VLGHCWWHLPVEPLSVFVSMYSVISSYAWSYMLMSLGYNGCSGSVGEYQSQNREVAGSTHTRSTASNLEQVVNLLCAQANSACYSQRDGKWVVAHLLWTTEWRLGVADWGNGVSASCIVGPIVRYHGRCYSHIMHCGTIGSCQSAAILEIVKRCWSRVFDSLSGATVRYSKCPDLYL